VSGGFIPSLPPALRGYVLERKVASLRSCLRTVVGWSPTVARKQRGGLSCTEGRKVCCTEGRKVCCTEGRKVCCTEGRKGGREQTRTEGGACSVLFCSVLFCSVLFCFKCPLLPWWSAVSPPPPFPSSSECLLLSFRPFVLACFGLSSGLFLRPCCSPQVYLKHPNFTPVSPQVYLKFTPISPQLHV